MNALASRHPQKSSLAKSSFAFLSVFDDLDAWGSFVGVLASFATVLGVASSAFPLVARGVVAASLCGDVSAVLFEGVLAAAVVTAAAAAVSGNGDAKAGLGVVSELLAFLFPAVGVPSIFVKEKERESVAAVLGVVGCRTADVGAVCCPLLGDIFDAFTNAHFGVEAAWTGGAVGSGDVHESAGIFVVPDDASGAVEPRREAD